MYDWITQNNKYFMYDWITQYIYYFMYDWITQIIKFHACMNYTNNRISLIIVFHTLCIFIIVI
jgi:hypothetical protein